MADITRPRVDHFEAMTSVVVSHFAKVPLFFWGRPGTGKSAMLRTVQQYIRDRAQDIVLNKDDDGWYRLHVEAYQDFGLVDNRLSQQEGIDIRGLFKIVQDDDGNEYTSTIRPIWLPYGGAGILAHDEYNMGGEDAKKAVMQLLTDGKVGTHILSLLYSQIGNGNLAIHKGLGKKLTPAEENRWAHMWMDDGDTDLDPDYMDADDHVAGRCAASFAALAVKDFTLEVDDLPVDIEAGLRFKADVFDPRVSAYVAARPHLVNTFNAERNKREDYGYASSRTWQYLSRVLQVCELFGKKCFDQVFKTFAYGLLGPGPAEDFCVTLDLLDKLIDLDKVKHDGANAPLPLDDPKYKIGVTFVAISALATAGHFNKATGKHIIDYVRRLPQVSPEIPPVFLQHLEANARKVKSVEEAICDPDVGYMDLKRDYMLAA